MNVTGAFVAIILVCSDAVQMNPRPSYDGPLT